MHLYGLARSLLTDPLFWVVLMLALGFALLRLRPIAGRRWIGVGLMVLVLLGWRALPDRLMHALETWHTPANLAELERYAGVVGGSFERASLQSGREAVQLNAHADRLTEAVALALALAYPDLPIIFTGGCVDTGEGCVPEAALARWFFTCMGLAPERIRFEAASRTTFEDALPTAQLPGVDKTRPWPRLTSAWHMPRGRWPRFAPRAET
jgi:uncharacterized SAM-binding protein YcdF (DUF218 family)